MRNVLIIITAFFVFLSTGCGDEMARNFDAEYEVLGITSEGILKNDTYIFKGETNENGEIIDLEFDIIRNKGTEEEYSKKGLMNYLMNISDVKVTSNENGYTLDKLTAYGYDNELGQFMISAKKEELTPETLFGELEFQNDAEGGLESVEISDAIRAFSSVAKEGEILDLNERTPVADIVSAHGIYADGEYSENEVRISFEGVGKGRSYGEQIEAIKEHIIKNKMTLEEVYDMFKNENKANTPIEKRDAIAGASIEFTSDFSKMVYNAMNGESFEGVVSADALENGEEKYTVSTTGYGGEIETLITIDQNGNLESVSVLRSNETPGYGADLTEENSEFLASLVRQNGEVDVVAGVTKTSNAIINAVKYAKNYSK